MTKSFLRILAAVLGAAALIGAALPVRAASITYTDNNCASFSVSGSGGNFTLICASLACSITSSAGTNITPIGTPTTLTASCNPAASGYTWTSPATNPSGCPGMSAGVNTANVSAPSGAVAGCVYKVDATSASNGGGTATVTLSWSSIPPSPPTCSALTASTTPAVLTIAGGTVAVNSNCTAQTGITYTWTRTAAPAGAGAFAASGSASQGDTLAANAGVSGATYTYQLQACTAPGVCAAAQSISVIVPGTSGGGISCNGFTNTLVLDVAWGSTPMRYFTSSVLPGFHQGVATVVRFTPPLGTASAALGSISYTEYGDTSHTRYATLSDTACQWSNPGTGALFYSIEQISGRFWLQVGGNPRGYPVLTPGKTYYLNIENTDAAGNQTCAFGESCNMGIDWAKPPGT
jgi:hypothetical protein